MRKFYVFALFICFSFGLRQSRNLPPYVSKPIKPLPQNKQIIFLGRTLFFDPILSADSTISCSSCHSPYNAFAHSDHALSHGINDQIGIRNAPALFNLAWQTAFMWDGAINRLDAQVLAPIHHPKEMNNQVGNVLGKLRKQSNYRQLFKKAYGDTSITTERFIDAIAQFENTLLSFDSKYDSVRQGKVIFTEQEDRGYALFKSNCSSCHPEPLFTAYQFKTNGLEPDSLLNDLGRYLVTNDSSDLYLFKVPSLRNLSFSAPYMHDGRFGSLNQVLKHYSEIKESKKAGLGLTGLKKLDSDERVDLLAFLLCLNDKRFIFNPEHTFPRPRH
jgi:cytochrome c peroxidase